MRLTFHTHATIPAPERLVLSGGSWRRRHLPVRYGVLERPGHGPVLIDAGWPVARPGDGVVPRLYRTLLRARVDRAADPAKILAPLGAPEAILLSHLHADHVGALPELSAPIHASRGALDRALAHPRRALRHGVATGLLPDPAAVTDLDGGDVPLPHGLGLGRDVLGDGSVLSVPLPGHADGQTGFLMPSFEPHVLYAADAQWLLPAILEDRLPRGPMTAVYHDAPAVPRIAARLRAFVEAGGRLVLNHDPAPVGPFAA